MKLLQKMYQKKNGGFDGLIVTIGLILLVMILIFLLKERVNSKIEAAMTNVGTEIEQISAWDASSGTNTNNTNP